MAKIKNPLQFSKHFGVAESVMMNLGIFDPTLNIDAKLFIDPMLLVHSRQEEIRQAETTLLFHIIIVPL